MIDQLENLPLLAPDASRGARTVKQCRDRLARERQRREQRGVAAERLLLAGVCMGYLLSMAVNVFRVLW